MYQAALDALVIYNQVFTIAFPNDWKDKLTDILELAVIKYKLFHITASFQSMVERMDVPQLDQFPTMIGNSPN